MSHRFVKNPSEAVSVGQVVKVKVMALDHPAKRIALSMKAMLAAPEPVQKKPRPRPERAPRPATPVLPMGERPTQPIRREGTPKSERPPRPDRVERPGQDSRPSRPAAPRGPRPEASRDGVRPDRPQGVRSDRPDRPDRPRREHSKGDRPRPESKPERMLFEPPPEKATSSTEPASLSDLLAKFNRGHK